MDQKLILLLIGLGAGILSGLVGIGGGIIIVPALVFFLGYTQIDAQGTSLAVLLLPVGIFAVLNFYKNGHVNINATLLISGGFVFGALFGSYLTNSVIPPDIIKKIFGLLLLFVAYKMLFN